MLTRIPALLAILTFSALRTAPAQTTPTMKEARHGLLAQAKINPDTARAIALRRVPGGQIQEAEVEMEHKKLVFSFDITVPGRKGIEEVLVDALTGEVLSAEHETPAMEAAEARKDAKARKDARTAGKKP